MIIITGPGRSGTSVVARLYRELGFDPGGQWDPSIRAGLEEPDITEVNNLITAKLGCDPLIRGHGPGILYRYPYVKGFAHAMGRILPRPLLSKVTKLFCPKRDRTGQLRLINWERIDNVVETYKTTLQELSHSHVVVKDPRFSWTLPVWAAAGAQIDHVVLCIRALDSMVRSRLKAGHLETRLLAEVKNSLIYGTGVCLTGLYSYDIQHSIVQFPNFLNSPETLYSVLHFPEPVSYLQFAEAFYRIIDKENVHE